MMTNRERVMAALNHQKPDRPPLNYFGTDETTDRLLQHLNLDTHEDLLNYFGADLRYVSPAYVGPDNFSGLFGYGTGGVDMWGIGWRRVSNDFCAYYEPCYHPLAQATTVQEVEDYAWPKVDWLSVAHIADDIRRFNQTEPKAIVFTIDSSFLETAWAMRGFERFLIDMVEYPEIVSAILRRVTELITQITMRALEEAQGGIDIIWNGGDVGMQTGMMFSPVLWRKLVKPFHRQLVEPYKKLGLKTRYHSDGAIVPIIGDLIEMGLDLLDPIQPCAPEMAPENLASLFGGKISFYGGVDSQYLLPYGTAREVEDKVLHLIHVLGQEGGYIVAASNAVQPDVPIENVLTLYRTAREFQY